MNIQCLLRRHSMIDYGIDEGQLFHRYKCIRCGKVGSRLTSAGVGAALLMGWSDSKIEKLKERI